VTVRRRSAGAFNTGTLIVHADRFMVPFRAAALALALALALTLEHQVVDGQTSGSDASLSEGCAGQSLANTTDTNVSVTASTQLITGVAGQRLHLCHVDLIATGGANNVALVEGTGVVCATGISGLFGGTTAATGWGFAASGGIVIGDGRRVVRRTAVTGDNLCILVSAATQVSGLIRWTSF